MQIFHRSTNTLSRATIYGAIFVVAALFWAAAEIQRSPYVTYAGSAPAAACSFQPSASRGGAGNRLPLLSHFGGNLELRWHSAHQDLHELPSQIWTNAPLLEPVRESFKSGKSLVWNRVNDLPDFVYFNHSIHINKGVGCNTCHGPVDRMPLMYNYASLQMEWCLDCHRAPEKYLRPRDQVFNMRYEQPSGSNPVVVDGQAYTDQLSLGTDLVKKYKLRTVTDITSCSTCHR